MRILRSTLLNIVGFTAPLLAALYALPVLADRLGAERFGFLSLAWIAVGYFSMFDLGIGRALSRLIAERLDTPRAHELPALSRNSLFVLLALGAGAAGLLFAASGWLATTALRLPIHLQAEATDALRVLALCLPFITLTAAMRGMLEASHRFGWVNAIRIPFGVLTFLVPVAVSAYSISLFVLCASLSALRVAIALAHWLVCIRLFPEYFRLARPTRTGMAEVWGYGFWMTASNMIGPLMVYLDRFVIATFASIAAVAYYTVPYEVVTKLLLLPAALTGVLFPVFAATHIVDRPRMLLVYRRACFAVAGSMVLLAVASALLAEFWLEAWLGPVYAAQGTRVAQYVSIGVFFNSIAYLPYTLLQAAGRADVTAKIHLAELPLYALALVLAVPVWGIEGAAMVWAARCAIDALIMFRVAHAGPGSVATAR